MDNEEIDVYLSSDSQGCYLESLVKCRRLLLDAPDMLSKLEQVIDLELDLAIMGSEKAKSEVLKNTKLKEVKDNLRPIK